ncbi:hypothetical protein ABZV75_10935 [Streptomyces flaveolus]|uniref:hypothetical protein n=1 Tax=Streptomyces flaveolus TaxID=67297 RepID=UPI0033A53A0C
MLSAAVTELLAQAGPTPPGRCGAEAEVFLRAVVSLAVSPFLTGGQRSAGTRARTRRAT